MPVPERKQYLILTGSTRVTVTAESLKIIGDRTGLMVGGVFVAVAPRRAIVVLDDGQVKFQADVGLRR